MVVDERRGSPQIARIVMSRSATYYQQTALINTLSSPISSPALDSKGLELLEVDCHPHAALR